MYSLLLHYMVKDVLYSCSITSIITFFVSYLYIGSREISWTSMLPASKSVNNDICISHILLQGYLRRHNTDRNSVCSWSKLFSFSIILLSAHPGFGITLSSQTFFYYLVHHLDYKTEGVCVELSPTENTYWDYTSEHILRLHIKTRQWYENTTDGSWLDPAVKYHISVRSSISQ
jgi:hypothetical protein